jgi:murein L,D-transpeptidase YafK
MKQAGTDARDSGGPDTVGKSDGGATRRWVLTAAAGLVLVGGGIGRAAAAPFVHIRTRADHVIVGKRSRMLYLMRDKAAYATYKVALGFAPEGHKTRAGDGRTPEGNYWIDRRNPRSDYHLSIGVSYPNATDVARARSLGIDPGGDIFIHGEPVRRSMSGSFRRGTDWTAGCIAVTNDEMEEIWATVPTGIPISILA